MSPNVIGLSSNHQLNDLFYGVSEISPDSFETIIKTADDSFIPDQNNVMFLVSGSIACYYHYPNGKVLNPYRMHYFDLVGVYEMFYPSQVHIKYKAVTDVQMLAISKQAFVDLTKANKDFYQRILLHLINRENIIADYYINLIGRNVDQRLINYIVFAIDIRYFDEHETFTIQDSHKMMADSLGCNIRSIHRSIKKLVEMGMITLTDGKITINRIQYQKCETLS